jgi:hypothetical protein
MLRDLVGDFRHAAEPSAWAREVLQFEPDAKQQEFLESDARRGIVCCSRQWGKSTTAAVKAVHHLRFVPGAVVVLAAPAGRQTLELALKVEECLRRAGLAIDRHNELGYFLAGGGRLIALPGNATTVRGISGATLLIIDEAAKVPEPLRHALSPFLATTNGALWELSTPFGKRGFFYRHWSEGSGRWHQITATAEECPRISREHLEAERWDLGELVYRQVYCCEFLDLAQGLFDVDLVLEAVTDEEKPLCL